ncbi:hypothetical protein C0Q70_11156 [Pomacea canaliculata]|uniref:Temptin Cys/Cys disulfide domain-containing protein n=1 Tax=Pomacea canaliculata TaxID=400727 RepID=A0A2T7P569_POMCA|nr:hypothetical protein C0Q70_11156 [Pomacea canaliculata]
MTSVTVFTSILAVALLPLAESYSSFQDSIPNGRNVRNPCNQMPWPGVGHRAIQGGGRKNRFGVDFAAAGNMWTPELCRKDSDNDGVSNGEELGDVFCRWSISNPINLASPKGHPGMGS